MLVSPIKIWRNQRKNIENLNKTGRIENFTIIWVPAIGFENQVPYPVVIVRLGKKKMTGQLVDYNEDNLKVGQKVKTVLRRVTNPSKEGVIPYGIKFKPISEDE